MFGHVLNELYVVKFGKSFSLLAYIGFKCATLKKKKTLGRLAIN